MPAVRYEIVKRAITFAQDRHRGIVDDNKDDYFAVHLTQVANVLTLLCPDDPNLIAAGYLHDVIEDTNTTEEEIRKEFGDDIADLVMAVTKEDRSGWGYYFPRLTVDKHRAIILKYADRISNLSRPMNWDKARVDHYFRRSVFWKTEDD